MRSAKVTVACIEVPAEQSRNFGVMRIDAQDRIAAFQEKPDVPFTLPGRPDRALASMGIYIFDAAFLYEQLLIDADIADSSHDFGKDVIPRLVNNGADVFVHHFSESCINMAHGEPYWRDVGTLDAYWEANIDLTKVVPELNLYDASWPVWTSQGQFPPAKFVFDDEDHRLRRLHRERLDGATLAPLVQRACARLLHNRGFGGPPQRGDRRALGGEARDRRQALQAAAGVHGRRRSRRGPAAFPCDREGHRAGRAGNARPAHPPPAVRPWSRSAGPRQ